MPDTDPHFPRQPEDPENLSRLRAQAQRRLNEEPAPSVVVYGGPPAPVYGGPPSGGAGMTGDRRVTRRWTLAGLIVLALGAISAIPAWLLGCGRPPGPVYGGPPPSPSEPPNPVYGGPVGPPPGAPGVTPGPMHFPPSQPLPEPQNKNNQPAQPSAPVYGGPPPTPPPSN